LRKDRRPARQVIPIGDTDDRATTGEQGSRDVVTTSPPGEGAVPADVGAFKRAASRLGVLRQTLVGAFGIMILAVLIAGVLNYAFNIIMTRMLGETGAYSQFYSLSAIFLIVTMAAASFQTVITKFVAEFETRSEQDNLKLLVHSFSRWFLYIVAAVMVISVALAWPLAHVLKLDSPLFVVILGTSISMAVYLSLPMGLLQGQQKFIGLGSAAISQAVLRILFGVVLVAVGFGIYGALGAATLGGVVVAGIILYYYRDLFRGEVPPVRDFHPTSALRYLVPVAVAMFFIIMMTQIDVVLVRAVFSSHNADLYSYGALAGKAVLFFPEGISVVMFPIVAARRSRGEPTRGVLGWSLGAVTVIVVAVAGFFALFPNFTAWFFAGEKGKAIANLKGVFGIDFIVLFGIAMAIFAVVKLLALYHLALERKAFIVFFVVGGIAEIAGILLYHRSLPSVLTVIICVGLFLLISNLALALVETPVSPPPSDTDLVSRQSVDLEMKTIEREAD
jgi:O-antigen/teichoic acid export membrane protein